MAKPFGSTTTGFDEANTNIVNTSSCGLNLTGGGNSSLLMGQQNNSLLLGQQQQQQQLLSMSNSPYGSGGVIGSVLKNTPLGVKSFFLYYI